MGLGRGTRRQEQLPSPVAESGCAQLPQSFSVLFVLGDRSGSLQEQMCHGFPAPPLLSGEGEYSMEKRYVTQVHQSLQTQGRLKVQPSMLVWWEASTARCGCVSAGMAGPMCS